MDKEIDVFIEQLREKDCQIERLQHIIENLTKKEDEEDEVEERPEQHVPTFWEKHPRISYVAFGLVMAGAIAVVLFPWWWRALWNSLGSSAALTYTFASIGSLGIAFLCWMQVTPAGKRFLKRFILSDLSSFTHLRNTNFNYYTLVY